MLASAPAAVPAISRWSAGKRCRASQAALFNTMPTTWRRMPCTSSAASLAGAWVQAKALLCAVKDPSQLTARGKDEQCQCSAKEPMQPVAGSSCCPVVADLRCGRLHDLR